MRRKVSMSFVYMTVSLKLCIWNLQKLLNYLSKSLEQFILGCLSKKSSFTRPCHCCIKHQKPWLGFTAKKIYGIRDTTQKMYSCSVSWALKDIQQNRLYGVVNENIEKVLIRKPYWYKVGQVLSAVTLYFCPFLCWYTFVFCVQRRGSDA